MTQPPPIPVDARTIPRNDPLGVALFKTIGSMLISIVVYAVMFHSPARGQWFGVLFAVGFVLLILVHELGHSIALRYFGLSASPPIFIPFLGAFIAFRQFPRNALEESIVGIAGPVLGTLGAAVTYAIYLQTNNVLLLRLAEFGFFLNLINLLPVPPLDGGRVAAAVSPMIWMLGLLALVAWIIYMYIVERQISFFMILLLIIAWPRVKAALAGAFRGPYFQIPLIAKWAMGTAYVLLGAFLFVMLIISRYYANQLMGPGWL